jgi:hypothetical protein
MANKRDINKKHIENKNIVSKQKSRNKEVPIQNTAFNYHLIPIFIILCILPFIVSLKEYSNNLSQYSWFSSEGTSIDLFLYYRHWVFVIVAVAMALVLILKAVLSRKTMRFSSIFIPLGIYMLLALLSSFFSKYSYFSFHGSFEQFESVFALMGYCIIAYYAYLFINEERDLKLIVIYILAVALLMSLLGVFQFFGYDFFSSELGYNLVVPMQFREKYKLDLVFGDGRVYLTLYNPNYVGSFVALVLPIITIMLFFQKKIILVILSILTILGLIISIIGAGSLTGFIALGAAVFFILIFMWRYLIKRFYITVPIILICFVGLFIYDKYSNMNLLAKLLSNLQFQDQAYTLTDLETKDDCVSLTYNGNVMNVVCVNNDDKAATFVMYDNNGQEINGSYDANTNAIIINDQRFPGIIIGADAQFSDVFYIQVDGKNWRFTNNNDAGTYNYVNIFNRADKVRTAPSALFTNHEAFASGRGYIWSRTIPLIKKYIFLGSGPDTYTMAFPQQDYLYSSKSGYEGVILTKPHNQYLQIAIQTGLLSLIAFLLFYGLYFASSVLLYLRGRYTSYYAKLGVAIFIGTIAYMVTGLANDSSITTAPLFWTLIGIGIAVNQKARPLIRDEIAVVKQRKAEFKKEKDR